MSSSLRAFIGPGSFVYVCPACQSVEEDVNKLTMNTDIPQSVILCCPNCDPFIAVDKVDRSDYHQAVLESNSLNEASQPPLEGVPSAETTPSPPCESKKEEKADDEMDHAARSSVVEVQAATTLSSKSEEVLVGIQNLSINKRIASSRAADTPVRVEYY